MTKTAGVDVLLSVSTDGISPAVVLGGQTGASLSRQTSVIEVTSKDGEGWSESISGVKSWGVDCDGFMVKDDAGLEALNKAWEDGTPLTVNFVFQGNKYEGKAILSDFPVELPMDDAISFSISLTGTGKLSRGVDVLPLNKSVK